MGNLSELERSYEKGVDDNYAARFISDKQQSDIDYEVRQRMLDVNYIEEAIVEQCDVLAIIIKNNKDVAEKITETVKHYIENAVEDEAFEQ